MTQILAQVGLGISIFIVLAYFVTKYLASKTHPTPEKKEVLTPIDESFSKQVEKELYNVEERQVIEEKIVTSTPITTPKKKRKYYPKNKK